MYLSFCITILIFAHFLINYFFQCINENDTKIELTQHEF